jgi:hypothetical protein
MTASTDTPTFAIGERVTVDSPRFAGNVYTVDRKLPKNYKLRNVATGGMLTCDPFYIRRESDAPKPADAGNASVTVMPLADEPSLEVGALVQFAQDKASLYVVIRDSYSRGTTTYSIVKLGGAGGRYYRGVHRRHLTVVKLQSEAVTPA